MKGKTPLSDRLRDGLVSTLEVPGDLARGDTLLTLTGHSSLQIENFRKLLKCSECEMIVLGKTDTVRIQGNGLKIDSFCPEELSISGCIFQIRLEGR